MQKKGLHGENKRVYRKIFKCLNCNKELVRNQAKFCSRKCRRAVYYQTSTNVKEHNKRYIKSHPEKNREYHKKYYSRFPEKREAHDVRRKLKISENQFCEMCNKEKATCRHHEDYKKPLEVKFLCRHCHGKYHSKSHILNPIMNKLILITILFLTFFLPMIMAQPTIVQVQQPPATPEKTSWFSFAFLKSPIFLGLVLFIVLAGVIAILLFVFIRWIIKYIKQRNDMFYKLKVERLKLAKIHSTYPSKHWYNVEKNIPIRLIRRINNNPIISSPIAYHRGDFISNEGNYIIALNFVNKKKWFIFPITDLLVVPNNQKVRLIQKDKDGKKTNETIISLPKAEDILKFHNREILIHADSLSHSGMFYIPVIKSREGNVVDLALPIYQTLKNVVLEDYLYETTSEFASLSKKAMDLNPFIRSIQKTSDSNQSVELPTN